LSKPRTYSSPLRAARAAETRIRIQRAAGKLFAERGFTATTISGIAQEAGVSVDTVYAIFGSKAAIVASMLEFFQHESQVNEIQAAIGNEQDPRRQLRIFVNSIRHLFDLGGDLFSLALEAPTQPEMASMLEQGDGARLKACHAVVAMWKDKGVLPVKTDKKLAAETIYRLTSLETYFASIRQLGLTPDEHEEWVVSSLERLVFDTAMS
jgi:AcrR family transcriptional regulator